MSILLLLFLQPAAHAQNSSDGKPAYEGELEVRYMLMERFILLKRQGQVRRVEEGYLLQRRGDLSGVDRKEFLIHTDPEEAVKQKPEGASGDRIYILYYNSDTPDPEALMEKYEVPDTELSSKEVEDRRVRVRVEDRKIEPIE
jgi:hypothetical protein